MSKCKTRHFTIPTAQYYAILTYINKKKKKLTLDEFAQLAIAQYDPDAYCDPNVITVLDHNAQLAVQIMTLATVLPCLLTHATLLATDREIILTALQDLTELTSQNFELIKRVEQRAGRRIPKSK